MNEEISHLSSIAKKKKLLPKILLGLGTFILIALLVTGGYFSYQYWVLQKTFGVQKASMDEVKRLTSDVGKFMLLPNEIPTIGTINDISKLKDQSFFDNAKNGDKILIYTNAKEAILYRPSAHLIIAVAPVNIGGQVPSQASVAKLGLRNGTDMAGLSYKVEGDIQKAYPGANVVLRDQSKRNDYSATIVIPLSDAANGAASDLAKTLNATVATLPGSETRPTGVDILVIVGKDRT